MLRCNAMLVRHTKGRLLKAASSAAFGKTNMTLNMTCCEHEDG